MKIQNIKMAIYSLSTPIRKFKDGFLQNTGISTAKTRELKIAKYVKFHNTISMESDAANQIYAMREPIAKFAKKYNLTIDIYNPQNLECYPPKSKKRFFSEKIGIVVSNKKTKKHKALVLHSDTDRIYPKEKSYTILLPISGEQDIQVPRKAISTRDDVFLKHILRSLEDMRDIVCKHN